MILSAIVIESATQASNAGDGLPSQCASLRAAKMAAAMSRTRFRPSSTGRSVSGSLFIRHDASAIRRVPKRD
jgi:hypothetical protein